LLIALAAICGFLSRQPLKFAMQDALRRRAFPRTKWCALLAAGYLTGGLASMTAAVWIGGWRPLLAFAAVAPLALVTLVFDAKNRSRSAVPELAGSIAMASTAAAIPLAGGWTFTRAFVPMALVVLRGVPAVVYVRTLLARAHRQTASSWPALALHAIATPLAWIASGSAYAVVMTIALLARAGWGLTHPVPRAQTVGWTEIGWGAVAIAAFIAALL
jgi:hypothetical protein